MEKLKKKIGKIKVFYSISRIDHWPKQIFLVPGFVYIFIVEDLNIFNLLNQYHLILSCFVCTCLIASANYSINEYLDSKYDKYHPLKKQRALVSKSIKLIEIIYYYFFLIFFSFYISYLFNHNKFFNYLLLIFAIAGILYNVKPFRSKDIFVIDILSEALNNPIRFLLAYFSLSSNFEINYNILLSYWFGGAFLMACKRYAERRFIKSEKILLKYRPSLAKYSNYKLLFLIILFSILSILYLYLFFLDIGLVDPFFSLYFITMFIFYFYISTNNQGLAQTPEKLFFKINFNLFLIFFLFILYILFKIS